MKNTVRCLFLFILAGFLQLPVNYDVEIEGLKTDEIEVELAGAVNNPGIFTMPAYSSTEDLLVLAELKQEADLTNINGTIILKDKDKIVIPEKVNSVLKVSINHSSLEELVLIPNIGKATAENIISYREEKGYFQCLDDLVKVKGIGIKTLEKILPYITL